MDWLVTAAGALLVLIALRDIFHTLWHPRDIGTLSGLLFNAVWRTTKLLNRSGRPGGMTGPLGVLVTVLVWTGLVVVGWMLIYLPFMPEGFNFDSSIKPGAESDVVLSAYLSLVAVATLGLGDVMPADTWLRILVPLQALVGFVLLTAGISWMLQIYPALSARRALARRVRIMARTDTVELVRSGDPSVIVQLLDSVTAGITDVELDLMQYAETYYFRDSETETALPSALPYLLDLSAVGRESSSPEVRHAAAMLGCACQDLARRLDDPFLRTGGSVSEVFEAYRADHHHPAVSDGDRV